jgi:hypothetical protein
MENLRTIVTTSCCFLANKTGSNSSLSSSSCDCVSCRDRRDIEAKENDELDRLRKCWIDVREDVWRVYHLVLCNAWNDPNRSDEKPDMSSVKEKVHKLVWRDPHQLFQRLEAGVREFVLEIKLKLIELLQKQAKDPSLAQDFIQCKKFTLVLICAIIGMYLYQYFEDCR